MTRDDPLASPTLAQLYITQGHYARAARVIETVLEAEPYNGHALALRARLEQRRAAHLTLSRDEGGLELRYERPGRTGPGSGRVHVLFAVWSLADGHPRAHPMRSIPCDASSGRLELPAPDGPASVCACLATLDPSGALRVLAVASPLTW